MGFMGEMTPALMPRFPFDGYLRLAFFGYNNNSATLSDTSFRMLSVSFTYELWINNTTQIVGEEHTVTQATEYNRVLEREIFTSDSPRSNVAGALFVGTTLTSQWGDDDYRFGQISILDEMLLRGIPRYKFEGDFRGLVYMDNILTPDFLADRRFFMTGLTVDYGQGISAIYADEVSGPDDLTYGDFDYDFKYLYK